MSDSSTQAKSGVTQIYQPMGQPDSLSLSIREYGSFPEKWYNTNCDGAARTSFQEKFIREMTIGEMSPPPDFVTDSEDEGTNTNNGYNCDFRPTSSSILEGDNCPANSDNLADGAATHTSHANKFDYMATSNWLPGNQSPPPDFVTDSENGYETSTSYSAEDNSNESTRSSFPSTKRPLNLPSNNTCISPAPCLNERSPDDEDVSQCEDDTDMKDYRSDDEYPSDGDQFDDGHMQRSYVRPSSAHCCNNLHPQPHRRSDELRRTGSSKARSDAASPSLFRDIEPHVEDPRMRLIHGTIVAAAPPDGLPTSKIRKLTPVELPKQFHRQLTKRYACCIYDRARKRYSHDTTTCIEEYSAPLNQLRGHGGRWKDEEILRMITLLKLHDCSGVAKILKILFDNRRACTAQSVSQKFNSVEKKYQEGSILSNEIKEEMSTIHRKDSFHCIVADACEELTSPTGQDIEHYMSLHHPMWDWDTHRHTIPRLRCFEIVEREGSKAYSHDRSKCRNKRMFSFFDQRNDDDDFKKAAKVGKLARPAKKKLKTGVSKVASELRLHEPLDVQSRPRRRKKTFIVPQALMGVTFFRSISKRPLQRGEVISESDDELDERWMYRRKHAEIDKADLPEASRRFLKVFDDFMHEENLQADMHVGGSIIRFARGRGVQIWRDGIMWEFVKKLNELLMENVISSAVYWKALETVSEQKVGIQEDNELSQRQETPLGPADYEAKNRPAKEIGFNPEYQTCPSLDRADGMYHSVYGTNKDLAPQNDRKSKDETIVAETGYLTPINGDLDGDVNMSEASLENPAELLGTTHDEDENTDPPYDLQTCQQTN